MSPFLDCVPAPGIGPYTSIPSSAVFTEPKMQKLWCACIHWGWAPRSQLSSALGPVVNSVESAPFPGREAWMRSVLTCENKEKIWNGAKNYAGLAKRRSLMISKVDTLTVPGSW